MKEIVKRVLLFGVPLTSLLLLGGNFLGWLFSSWLLGCWLLGRWLLGCWLLGGRLLGLSGGLLCGLLGLGGLLHWLLGLLSSRLLLGLDGLGSLWFLSELEGSSSLLTSSSSSDDSLGGDQLLQGEPNTSSSLGSVHLVVGTDVLQDGLTGGALLVSEGLDGGLDHGGVGGGGSGSLGFGSSSSSHGDVVLGCRCGESPH